MPCPKGFRCPPDCRCGKHFHTPEWNARIGLSNKLTHEAKKRMKT